MSILKCRNMILLMVTLKVENKFEIITVTTLFWFLLKNVIFVFKSWVSLKLLLLQNYVLF